jgi:hypothetical protein
MCSYGGNGFITDVNGDGVLRMFTVKYDKSGSSGGKTEAGIPYSRLTVVPSPFASTKLARERRAPEMLNNLPPQPPTTPQLMSIQAILAAGAARGKHKGWRAKELGVVEHGRRNERFNILLREDTKSCSDFFQDSRLLVLVVQLDTTKKDAMDVFQSGQLNTVLILSLILQKLGVLAKTFHWRILKKVQPRQSRKKNKPDTTERHRQS